MKKILAVAALTLWCGSAIAQITGAPAAAQSDMNRPGMNNNTTQPSMNRDSKGSMQQNNMGTTTGSAMKSSASEQGAPTGAPVDAKGTASEPGKVRRLPLTLPRKKPRTTAGLFVSGSESAVETGRRDPLALPISYASAARTRRAASDYPKC